VWRGSTAPTSAACSSGTVFARRTITKDLKSRFLAAIDHGCAAGDSPAQAFDRLRVDNPDVFPIPRGRESFLEACAEVVRAHEAHVTHKTTGLEGASC